MPNITVYLDNKNYANFILMSDEKQKEVREKAKRLIEKNIQLLAEKPGQIK